MNLNSGRYVERFLIAAGVALAVPLTAVERDKVFEIMHGQAPAIRDKGKAVRSAEEGLRKLVLSPEYSEPQARELVNEAAKAMSEMSLARAKAERLVYEVLTPEQRKQLADRKASGEPPVQMRGDGPRGRGDDRHQPPPGR